MATLFRYTSFYSTLILLTLLAALLRLPYLSHFPPLMLQDEVALGYNAISIAQTGRDEWGQFMPLTFKSFGDYKPPLFIYISALFYHFTGWTYLLPRLTSAIAGVLLVPLLTIYLKQITRSQKFALFGGIIAAIIPWSIYLSRLALESNLGLLFFVGALVFLHHSQKSPRYWLLGALFFIAAAYTYHAYRIVSLLVPITHLIISRPKKNALLQNPALLITLLSALIIIPGFFVGHSSQRLSQTLLSNPQSVTQSQSFQTNTCHLVANRFRLNGLSTVCRLLWNRYTIPPVMLSQNALHYFSPTFLFFDGDLASNRNPTKQGAFYLILFPLFILGMFHTIKHRPRYTFLLISLAITLIPSALTGPPHAIRLTPLLPFALALITLGYKQLHLSNKAGVIVMGILSLNTLSFLLNFSLSTFAQNQDYLAHAPAIVQKAKSFADQGYQIYLDPNTVSEPHLFYAFINRIPPQEYQAMEKTIDVDDKGFSRPTILNHSLHFYKPEINRLLCQSAPNDSILIITRDLLTGYPASETVTDLTNTHPQAYFYLSQSLQPDSLEHATYCDTIAASTPR